jgi:TBC1 domain family member 10
MARGGASMYTRGNARGGRNGHGWGTVRVAGLAMRGGRITHAGNMRGGARQTMDAHRGGARRGARGGGRGGFGGTRGRNTAYGRGGVRGGGRGNFRGGARGGGRGSFRGGARGGGRGGAQRGYPMDMSPGPSDASASGFEGNGTGGSNGANSPNARALRATTKFASSFVGMLRRSTSSPSARAQDDGTFSPPGQPGDIPGPPTAEGNDRAGNNGANSPSARALRATVKLASSFAGLLRRSRSSPSSAAWPGNLKSQTEGDEGGGVDSDEALAVGQSRKIVEEDDLQSSSDEFEGSHKVDGSADEVQCDEEREDKEEHAHRLFEKTASEYEMLAAEQFKFVRLKNTTQEKQNRRLSHGANDEEDLSITEERKRVDRFGFLPPSSPHPNSPMGVRRPLRVSRPEARLENTRLEKWRAMLEKGIGNCADTVVKRRVRKGIPMPLKSAAWSVLLGVDALMATQPKLYGELQHVQDAPYEDKILRDIHRTLPETVFFREAGGVGQKKLFHVLRAVSVYDPILGYCQGMGYLTAFLLLFMTEEKVFWAVIALLKGHRWRLRGLYLDEMPRTMVVLYTLDKFIEQTMPELFEHFKAEGISTHMYATKWIMTLFAQQFSNVLVVRIWDVFYNEGWKIIYRIALALLKISEADLLDLTFEKILKYLQDLPTTCLGSEEKVLDCAFKRINITTKQMEEYEDSAEEFNRIT